MIVSKNNEQWEIIFQRAHAQLAADIAYNFHPSLHPKDISFSELLTAVADHDDGRIQWEGQEHVNSNGAPLNYKEQNLDVQLKQAQKSINNASYRTPWISLLTSMHHSFLYKPFAGEEKANEFLNNQQKEQERIMKLLGIDRNKAVKAYNFLLLCDQFSLILCEGKLRQPNDYEKIDLAPGMEHYVIVRLNEKYFTIDPWCFRENTCRLSVYTYTVPVKRYKNDRELLKAVRNSTATHREWNFVKTGG